MGTYMGKKQKVEGRRKDMARTSRQDFRGRGRRRDMDERAGKEEKELRRRRRG